MNEIRNARCLLLLGQWNQYADQQVDPICRSRTGSITPIIRWILYADPRMDPICRSLTLGQILRDCKNIQNPPTIIVFLK